ncbi:gibberellin 2-beta-dioxygenase-like [Lactuca sativa]|uniref:gibberellin 2-beta-dioxygenase-like n=1 Tax=Lactuca sativa TaxID=4236 RepID=UPI0022AF56FE|nr:gibberellin 2-beta-dioxygenase-like [Lactuca sativa]
MVIFVNSVRFLPSSEGHFCLFTSTWSLSLEQEASPSNPFGYGNKHLAQNGDFGWVEYLLLHAKLEPDHKNPTLSIFEEHPEKFQYESIKNVPGNVFTKLLMDEQSDSVFRLNYYLPCPELQEHRPIGRKLSEFGEHTYPQIISVLRFNNSSGLEIC